MRNLGYKTFLFTLIFYSQSVCCQTMSLNGALECAYNNFLGKVMPNNRYAEYGFYIVRNYNPYGFNFRFLKDDLASHLVTLKTAKLDSGLKKGKDYIGYPYFSVIGKDTLCINIGQKTYDKEGRITFTDGYVTGFCSDCSVNTFKELNISRGKMTALLGYAEEKGRVIVFDSIYVKALIDAIKQIQAGNVPLCDIYI
ncbi:MAG: hypothetical protein K6A82_00355 [Prevotella sp.]|nr:hypothetical protein [Prevotella sp.]